MSMTTGTTEAPARTAHAGWVLAMVIGTTSLTGISMSIMAVTFPEIRNEFPGTSPAQLSWINNLFTIVSAATLIPCGVLADRVGRKRMLLIGTAAFTIGSVIGALAPSPGWIMVGRTVQALGAASFGPASTALLISAFPPERLPTAIGIWAVTSGVTSAAGPSIGGVIIDWGGWPWAFWINLFIAVPVLILGPLVLRESTRDRARRLPDLLGVLLVMSATSVVTLGVVQPKTDPRWTWLGLNTLTCLATGALLVACFIARCRRIPNPLIRLELFRSANVRYGVLGIIVSGVAFYAFHWAFIQHTINEWDWSIRKAGVVTAPVSLVSGISAIISSRAATRYGQRPFAILGSIGVFASCVFLSLTMGDEPRVWVVLVGGSALGWFSGLVFPAFIATTLLGVAPEEHSVGSSVNFMAQRTSATLGTALAITFIAGASGNSGLHNSILVCALGSAAGVGLGLLLNQRQGASPRS